MNSLEDAIIFATESHTGQVRRGTETPYIEHPLRVMLAAESLTDKIVAVLHDVVEDCGVSLDVIGIVWGSAVMAGVDGCTRREADKTRGVPRETYGQFIERAAKNPTSCRVKILDIQDNLDRPVDERHPGG